MPNKKLRKLLFLLLCAVNFYAAATNSPVLVLQQKMTALQNLEANDLAGRWQIYADLQTALLSGTLNWNSLTDTDKITLQTFHSFYLKSCISTLYLIDTKIENNLLRIEDIEPHFQDENSVGVFVIRFIHDKLPFDCFAAITPLAHILNWTREKSKKSFDTIWQVLPNEVKYLIAYHSWNIGEA